MLSAPHPENESQRLKALLRYDVLDSGSEQAYDDIVLLAAQICGTPIALVSLVDSDRQWFKARLGIDAPETPRDIAFCSHAILRPEDLLVVPDATKDERFADNPLVEDQPKIRFYAGAPLVTDGDLALGTLCVIDQKPRELDEVQQAALRALARQITAQLELRLHVKMLEERTSLLEQKQRELERSNKDLDDFAYIVSHDLKEPLRGIHNYSQFLIEDYGEKLDDDGRSKLETIGRLTKRLDSLIESLLHFSRAGRTQLAIAATDLNEVVEGVIDSLHISLQSEEVQIRIPEPLAVVECDPSRAAEIFRNLITNAMKYNDKPEKWIEITCDSAAMPPVFSVRDNGIGIPEKHYAKIFQMFRRLHGRDTFGGGTGAGLCIVEKLVNRLGGSIRVDSKPGEGTTFHFTLCSAP